MSLWWLEKGWGDACCATCGANIKASGGDPDWGYCSPCFDARVKQQREEKRLEKEYWAKLQSEYEQHQNQQLQEQP